MSTTRPNGTPSPIPPSSPTAVGPARSTIRTTNSYGEAERIVDRLSDAGFPVESLTIVGTGLRYVEQVRGRLTTGRAAAMNAGQGATIGLFFGLLFTLFFDLSVGGFFGVLLYGVISGALFGALIGAVVHAGMGGRRDFASTAATVPSTFEVQVEPEREAEALRLLQDVA